MENLYAGEDSVNASELTKEQTRLLERRVVLLRFLAFTGTSQDKGKAPTRTQVPFECSGVIRLMTGKDILTNAGLYALGDIEFSSRSPMYDANNKLVTQADQMILDGVYHTMVGRVFPVFMAGGTTFYKAVFRRSS